MILEGTTSSGAVVPVQVTGDGKVVAEGLQGPQGPEGPEGPEGPPGPAGGYWERTGTVVSPTNAGDDITTTGSIGVGTNAPNAQIHVSNTGGDAEVRMTASSAGGSCILRFGNNLDEELASIRTTSGVDNLSFFGFNDEQRMVIDTSGRLLVGSNPATPAVSLDPGSTGSPLVRDANGRLLLGVASHSSIARLLISGRGGAPSGPGNVWIQREGAISSPTDTIAETYYADADGSVLGFTNAYADGVHTGTSKPSAVAFATTSSGATSPTERLRIDSQGDVTFQGDPIVKSPDGKHWAIQVDNNGNLGAYLVI